MSRTPLLERVRIIADRLMVFRPSNLKRYGIHHQILRRALDRGIVKKLDRALYTTNAAPATLEQQIIQACIRVPHGVVCLESALQFHGVNPSNSGSVWMAIGRKARKPALNRLPLRFVRFSGKALTGGVVNARIHGVLVRVYSVAKTIADCYKYRRKIGAEMAINAFRAGVQLDKCSRERVLHFASICRVGMPLRVKYRLQCTGAQTNWRSKRKAS